MTSYSARSPGWKQWGRSAVTDLWSAWFTLSGRFSGQGAWQSWSPGGGPVLIVAAHPDDETLGAGGVTALHVRAGDQVTVVVVTDGRRSAAENLSAPEMAARRAGEVVGAAEALGVTELKLLALPEDDWDAAEAAAALSPLVSAAGIIYGPSCVDFHPDHLALARVLAGLVRPGHLVRVYELGVPLSPTLANLVADTGAVEAVRDKALAAYVTQAQALGQAGRLARYRSAYYGLPVVEHFWALSGAAYNRVMSFGKWGWEQSPFRGLYARPTRDPLAYLTGRQTRRTLRRLVHAM